MTDIAIGHRMASRKLDVGPYQLHQKFLGQVSSHLLMGGKKHVIGLGIPGLGEMRRSPLIDERGVAATVPAVMQETLGMGQGRRLEGAKAVAGPHRLQAIPQHRNRAIQTLGTMLQATTGKHRLHRWRNGMGNRLKLLLIGWGEGLPIAAVQHLQSPHHLTVLRLNGHGERRGHHVIQSSPSLLMGSVVIFEAAAIDATGRAHAGAHHRILKIGTDLPLHHIRACFQPKLLSIRVKHEQTATLCPHQTRQGHHQ